MYRLKQVSSLLSKCAADLQCSRLGIGFEKLDRDAFDPEKAYDKLAAVGVKWIRIQSGWAKTEKQKGVYDFAWLDSIVDNLIARGMIPWMCMCYGNALYTESAKKVFGAAGCPPIHTEEEKQAWHNYCAATAKHFRGRVTHFEVWNEPDGAWCWKHGVNATELGQFNVDTARALREGNPEVYVIGGSLCQLSSSLAFLQEAFQTGMGDVIDGFTFHEYVYKETNVAQRVRAFRGFFTLHGKHIDIIQGESGSQSRPFGYGALRLGGWTPRKQAKQLLRHTVADLLADVKFTSFFSCLDMMEALNGTVGDKASYQDYGYFGILGADFDEDGIATGEYTPKPSYYALQNLSSLLGGNLVTMDLPVLFTTSRTFDVVEHTGGLPPVRFEEAMSGGFRLDNGSYAFAFWKPCELMTTEYEGATTLHTSIPCDEVHLVDPMDGAIYEIPESIMSVDDFGNRIFKDIPIKDYPMFLVFGKVE